VSDEGLCTALEDERQVGLFNEPNSPLEEERRLPDRSDSLRLRQVDVKAEHFERQVQRVEQERDEWERKHGVCRLVYYRSSIADKFQGSSREVSAVETRTGRGCCPDGELGEPMLNISARNADAS
jgi:hypothetical protein